jgi:hypothetical protein
MFAPWIRNIFVVTNGQRPAWLDVNHPRIRMVSHRDIFPDPRVLPTFNSSAIILNLHRIASLSEAFLVFDDDVFLGRSSARSEFFSKLGKIRVRFQEGLANANFAHPVRQKRSIAYCYKLLDETFGAKHRRYNFPHCPVMFNKTVFRQMEQQWQLHFDRTRAHRFRNERDIKPHLLFSHCLAETYEVLFREEEDENEIEYMKGQGAVYVAFGRPGFDLETVIHSIESERPRYICVNDEFGQNGLIEPHMESEVSSKLAAFLKQYFPQKAEWEL